MFRSGDNGPVTRRAVIRRIVLLALAAASLYLLAPGLVEVFSSSPQLRRIEPGWLLAMVGLEAGSFACQWLLLRVALHRPHWYPVITSQLAGNAFGKTVPGGGAAGAALQVQMLREAGMATAGAVSGVTAVNLLTFAVLLALPLLSLPAIAGGAHVNHGLEQALWVGFAMLAILFVLGAILLATESPLRFLGRMIQRARNRFRGDRPPLSGLPQRLVEERDLIRGVLGRRWWEALLASIGRWLLDLATLLVVLHAIGSDPRPSLVLIAYVAAGVLAQIPITPGGLGFVEAGLAATLALAGVGAGAAVLATLAYRLVSYWLPLPIGGVAWGLHRRRYGRLAPAPAEAVPEAEPG